MDYNWYKSRHPDHILLYIEEYNKIDKTIVVDFLDSKEYKDFFRIIELPMPDNEKASTMFCLVNYKKRRVQENTIYSVKPSVIKKWKESFSFDNQSDSFLLKNYTIDAEDIQEEIFSVPISIGTHLGDYVTRENEFPQDMFQVSGDLSVIIRKVGQGNWNEIEADSKVVIAYDCGASMHFTKEEVREIFEDRLVVYEESNPILLLSHWDKDHYHCLLEMSEVEISNSFSKFVCRDFLPNNTSRILFDKIISALGSENVIAIAAEDRPGKRGSVRLKNMNSLTDTIVLFNAQKHKNRNISGLLMLVQSKNNSVVLPGDAHYSQISSDILPKLKTIHTHNLVVPHHGGAAGMFVYHKGGSYKLGMAVISYGINFYGHPLKRYEDNLDKIGFDIKKTSIKGEINIPL